MKHFVLYYIESITNYNRHNLQNQIHIMSSYINYKKRKISGKKLARSLRGLSCDKIKNHQRVDDKFCLHQRQPTIGKRKHEPKYYSAVFSR